MPIQYNLESIDTLVAKKLGNAADPKVVKLKSALGTYCNDYLKPKGIVAACTGVPTRNA